MKKEEKRRYNFEKYKEGRNNVRKRRRKGNEIGMDSERNGKREKEKRERE